MRKIFMILIGLLWLSQAPVVRAATYLDLTPGSSTKDDVQRVFGPPLREVVKGKRYDYDPEQHEARRLSVLFQNDTIEQINIYLKKPYGKEKLKQWFHLKKPTKSEIDANGNLVEYYFSKGISLHYDGPDESFAVMFLSHFDRKIFERPDIRVTAKPRLSPTQRPYLGVKISSGDYEGIKILYVDKDSPAEKVRLKEEDIILEMAQQSFRGRKAEPSEFVNRLIQMPLDEPTRFLIRRGSREFEVRIALGVIEEKELQKASEKAWEAQKQKAKSLADEGRRFIDQQQYQKAIAAFQEANTYAVHPFHHKSIGYAHYRRGEMKEALAALKEASHLDPDDYYPYGLQGKIYYETKNYTQAIEMYKRALKLNPPDDRKLEMYERSGICYLKHENYAEALMYFTPAREMDRTSPTITYYLAVCYDQTGNKREAISFYRQYLRMPHDDPRMQAWARNRLNALTKDPERAAQTQEKFKRMLDIMIREIGGFDEE
jgi:tetratricopeptide (TPR) repeat protein